MFSLKKKRRIKGKFEEESEASRKDWFRYLDDVEKCENFEVGDYPHFDLRRVTGFPIVRRIYDSSHVDENLEDDMLLYLAKLAVCFYNIKEGTNFGDVKVVLPMRCGIKNENHYITFEAFLPKSKRKRVAVTFQTHIVVYFISPYPKFEIMFVRIKPSESDRNKSKSSQHGQPSELDQEGQIYQQRLSQVIETCTIDSRDSLTLYLSQYALFSYNLFTLSESVAKHDIESLKVVELIKPAAEVPTYHITFEAPLRAKTKRRLIPSKQKYACLPSSQLHL